MTYKEYTIRREHGWYRVYTPGGELLPNYCKQSSVAKEVVNLHLQGLPTLPSWAAIA